MDDENNVTYQNQTFVMITILTDSTK